MNAKTFNLSVQGASHIKKNKECQDASGSYCDENMAIAIVCDGHGGDDYMRSAVGSKCACRAAERNIKSFLENMSKEKFFSNPDKFLNNLEASIINAWNQFIYAHHEQKPFTEEELSGISEKARTRYVEQGRFERAYGTTLIAVAMTRDYWFGIHIGDGKCVAVNPEGKFVQPIPWDTQCFLNVTTSICDSDALGSFRHFYSEKLPVAVFVGSDGIDDCFSNNEQLHNLYKTILYSFGTSEFDEAVSGLSEYLPRLSAKGSGDDVSISAMLDMDMVPELEVVKEFDREKEKARVEENARRELEKSEEERRRVELEHARFQQQNNGSGKTEKKPKFCSECGAKLSESQKFCSECGSKVVLILGKPEINTDGDVGQLCVVVNEPLQQDDGNESELMQLQTEQSLDAEEPSMGEDSVVDEEVNIERQEEEIVTDADIACEENEVDEIPPNEENSSEEELCSECDSAETLTEDIVQETQKEDI